MLLADIDSTSIAIIVSIIGVFTQLAVVVSAGFVAVHKIRVQTSNLALTIKLQSETMTASVGTLSASLQTVSKKVNTQGERIAAVESSVDSLKK